MGSRSPAPSSLNARTVCEVEAFHSVSRPLSPWLRLAHRRRYPTIPPTKVPLQRLLDFELLLVLEGTSWLWVEPAGGAIRLGRGSLALIPPGLVHTWGEMADTHLAIHFDLCAQPGLAPLKNMIVSDRWVTYQSPRFIPEARWNGFDGAVTPIVQHLRVFDAWQRCMEELLALSAGRTSANLGLDEQSAVQTQLLWAVRAWIALETEKRSTSDPAQKVRSLLRHVDPTARNQIGTLARQAQLSPTAFRTAFRAVTGQSPRRWLEERRVDLAARRLLGTDLSIAAIADEVGYADAYHFSRVFKRITGKAPAVYRGALRDGGIDPGSPAPTRSP